MKRTLLLIAGTLLSFSAHAGPGRMGATTEWTKEQRETMAKNHESLAACLRSDKPVAECHEEMMKRCRDNNACPMKDGMGMHHGWHEGQRDKTEKRH